MPNIKIEIKNLPEIRAAFAKAPAKMVKELNLAIAKSIIAVQRETSINVSGGRGINVITGGLLNASKRGVKLDNLKGSYLVDIRYAFYVHEGTRFMSARPFLQEAVDSEQGSVDDNFAKAVQNVLDDIGREV